MPVSAIPAASLSLPITRRCVLLGLGAVPAFSGAEPEDPILPLYREWLAARAEWQHWSYHPDNGNSELPECKAAESRENAAYFALCKMTPNSLAGIAAIAHVLWTVVGPQSAEWNVEEYAKECRDDENKMLAAIWRAASGQEGVPPLGEARPPQEFFDMCAKIEA